MDQARIACGSSFKNVKRELLKSNEIAYVCHLSTKNCDVNNSHEEYAMNLTIQAEADCACGAFAVHKDETLLDQQRDVVVVFLL